LAPGINSILRRGFIADSSAVEIVAPRAAPRPEPSLQYAFERAFIIDDDVRPAHPKLRQRLSDHPLNRRAKLLLHNAVDFKLNTWLIRRPDPTITSLDSACRRASIIISIEADP
jgi:hypothetical protein